MSENPIERAAASRDPAYLAAVINALVKFLSSTSPADPAYQSWLADLAGLYYRLYELTRETPAIEQAIAIGRELAGRSSAVQSDYATVRSNLGRALITWYQEDYQDATLLDEAVAVLRQAVEVTADPRLRQPALSHLASALHVRHRANGDIEDIRQAAEIFHQLVEVTDAGHPMRLVRLLGLSDTLRVWFEACGDLQVLAEAIAAHRQLRDETFAEDPQRIFAEDLQRARILSNLGYLLGRKHETDQRLSLLEECTACFREGLDLTPVGDARRPGRLGGLGGALAELGAQTADPSLLDEAADILRQAADQLPGDSEDHRAALVLLGRCLVNAFRVDDRAERLDEAVAVLREAADKTPAEHEGRLMVLSSLATALSLSKRGAESAEIWDLAASAARSAGERADALSSQAAVLMQLYDTNQDSGLLDRAVALCRLALQTSPPLDTDEGEGVQLSANLASALFRRMDGGTENEVVELGIALTDVVRRTPAEHPRFLRRLSMLGTVTVRWLELATHSTERMHAVVSFREAAAALSGDQLRELVSLPFLDKALMRGFLRNGDPRLLVEAIEVGRILLSITLPDDPLFRVNLSNLATSLARHSELTNNTVSILESADLYERAIALASAHDHDRLKLLTNLTGVLALLPEYAGGPSRLDDALAAFRDALREMPVDHPERPNCLVNFAAALGERFGRQREEIAALHRRRTWLEWTLGRTPGEHPGHTQYVKALAEVRAELDVHKSQQLPGLGEAIDIHRQILASIPEDDLAQWANLTSMSVALSDKYILTADRAALDEAISLSRQALNGIGDDHPYRASTLTNLGRLIRAAAEASDAPEALSEALAFHRTAANIASAPASVRADAAASWGYVARKLGDIPAALQGLAMAVGLLDEVAWRGLGRRDQERMLMDYGTLAVDAAAAAIDLGEFERAVELLEQGRGVLLAQALDTRTDYERLHAQFPVLAAEFAQIHDDLEAAARPYRERRPDESFESVEHHAERKVALTDRRQRVLQEIRRQPGFRDFLRPPSYASLQSASSDGAVIIINISEIRCDALIITDSGIRHVPLANLTHQDVNNAAFMFLAALQAAQRTTADGGQGTLFAASVVQQTLDWLNEYITGPILRDLWLLPEVTQASPRPRVWWCPTGKLAFLPLHAAGYSANDEAAPTAVMDKVISSYTPTVRALMHARRPQGNDRASRPPSALIVAMPETPSQPDLPAAAVEARDYKRTFPDAAMLSGHGANSAAVLRELKRCSWVHFACHGSQDIGQASASQLHLYDGPLSAAEISRLRIAHGEFAFLSACKTSQVSNQLTDESLTVASGMLLAGYRHVIGTLWSIGDSLAPFVSKSVYSALQQNGVANATTAASALHATIHALRAMHPRTPLLWASYLHFGP